MTFRAYRNTCLQRSLVGREEGLRKDLTLFHYLFTMLPTSPGIKFLHYLADELNMPVDTLTAVSQRTALHVAAIVPRASIETLEMVSFLIEERRLDKAIKDANGETAADVAKRTGNTHLYEYLTFHDRTAAADAAAASLVAELDPLVSKSKNGSRKRRSCGKSDNRRLVRRRELRGGTQKGNSRGNERWTVAVRNSSRRQGFIDGV